MVFVINNQIFESLKYLCPAFICIHCPSLLRGTQGIVLIIMMNCVAGDALKTLQRKKQK